MLHKLFGAIGSLFSLRKTKEWNDDPRTQALAALLGVAAVASVVGDNVERINKECEVLQLLAHSGWELKEAGDRLIHAATMVNWWALPADVRAEAKSIAKKLYTSLPEGWD